MVFEHLPLTDLSLLISTYRVFFSGQGTHGHQTNKGCRKVFEVDFAGEETGRNIKSPPQVRRFTRTIQKSPSTQRLAWECERLIKKQWTVVKQRGSPKTTCSDVPMTFFAQIIMNHVFFLFSEMELVVLHLQLTLKN